MKQWFDWIARNEARLSTAVFVAGFVVDNVVYTRIDLPWVHSFFVSFLIGAALCILISHVLRHEQPDAAPSYRRPFHTLVPIAGQFFIGGLLSGCVIFYLRSASLVTSWPFLLILAVVFIGNEVFRKYHQRLEFQAMLFFFTLYAYAIFALPISYGKMGSLVFLGSGLAAVTVFAVFLGLLWIVGSKRLMQSMKRMLFATVGILIIVNASYFAGILPPLPLVLKDAGIYHSLTRVGADYQVGAESQDWNPLTRTLIHHVPGRPLYAYSAVFAPVKLNTPIVHRWQRYDDASGWVTVAALSFSISGGRDGGYRGYSIVTPTEPGYWRVSIETENGSVLGKERFYIESVPAPVPVHLETK